MMWIYLTVFIIAFIIFLGVDFIWLGFVAKRLYEQKLGHLMKKDVNFFTAFIFYIIFIIALSVFVIVPGIESGSLLKVILLGALFGLASYATYDLTNYSTIEGFPLSIVMIDLMWGTFLGTITATLTYLIYQGVF